MNAAKCGVDTSPLNVPRPTAQKELKLLLRFRVTIFCHILFPIFFFNLFSCFLSFCSEIHEVIITVEFCDLWLSSCTV